MQPSPVFLPGESHGERSLEGYSPWAHKESAKTEVTDITLEVVGRLKLSRGNRWYSWCLGTKELEADHVRQRYILGTKTNVAGLRL